MGRDNIQEEWIGKGKRGSTEQNGWGEREKIGERRGALSYIPLGNNRLQKLYRSRGKIQQDQTTLPIADVESGRVPLTDLCGLCFRHARHEPSGGVDQLDESIRVSVFRMQQVMSSRNQRHPPERVYW